MAVPQLAKKLLRRLLGVSTVYKVLLANVALAVVGAAIAGVVSISLHDGSTGEVHFHWRAFWFLLAVGIPGAFLVNLTVLRLAFRPLDSLVNTMEAVSQGDAQVRAREGLISDPLTSNMIATFNRMLDDLEASRQRLSVLAAKVVAAQEEERRRLSRELHDNAGQILTLAVLAVNAIKRAQDAGEVALRATEAEGVITQAAAEIRRAAVELRPIMLDDLGLAPALEWYVQQSASATGLPIELQVRGVDQRFPPETEVTIYRVVQEAITNVARHAQATKVSVVLSQEGDRVRVVVTDDGRGFDQRTAMRGSQETLGLFSMKERVVLLGGTLTVDSEPGRGTRVIAEIPVPPGQKRWP